MHRRRFIHMMARWLKAALLVQLAPAACAMPPAGSGSDRSRPEHFRPLDGLTLRKMAARKLHHGPDGRFVNPLATSHQRRSLARVLRWKLFSKNAYSQVLDDQPVRPVHVDWEPIKSHRGLSVTFIKHACILIKDRGRYLIVDPVFFHMFPLIKDYTPTAFDVSDVPAPDHILVTHGHYDHISTASLETFKRHTHVISPLGHDAAFASVGMTHRSRLDWFDTVSDGGLKITLLPCNHWTMRNPIAGPNRSLWGSYMIETASGKTIYVAGDTAYFDGFAEIGRLWDIDLAIFNLGAYAPRWFMAGSHIDPRETVAAFEQLGAKKLMIVHWGTFQLGDEPVHFPPLDLQRELAAAGGLDRWIDIRHGQTWFA